MKFEIKVLSTGKQLERWYANESTPVPPVGSWIHFDGYPDPQTMISPKLLVRVLGYLFQRCAGEAYSVMYVNEPVICDHMTHSTMRSLLTSEPSAEPADG